MLPGGLTVKGSGLLSGGYCSQGALTAQIQLLLVAPPSKLSRHISGELEAWSQSTPFSSPIRAK